MFVHLLLVLLKGKASWLVTAKIPLIATLLVLSTTGFIVTGTISNGDDGDEDEVNLTITPLESKMCLDALVAQTETLLTLDVLAGDTAAQLRQLRGRARERADDLHKLLNETALLERYNAFAAQVPDELARARQAVLAAADLGACQDGNKDTTVNLDLADLRARYDQILRDFGRKMSQLLLDAQTAFNEVVQNSPDRPRDAGSGSGHSDD